MTESVPAATAASSFSSSPWSEVHSPLVPMLAFTLVRKPLPMAMMFAKR